MKILKYPYEIKKIEIKNAMDIISKNSSRNGWILKWEDDSFFGFSDLVFFPDLDGITSSKVEMALDKIKFSFADKTIKLPDSISFQIKMLLEAQWEQAFLNFQKMNLMGGEYFEQINVIDRSNYLFGAEAKNTDEILKSLKEKGISTVKIKLSSNYEKNLALIMDFSTLELFPEFSWRLDANSQLDEEQLIGFFEHIPEEVLEYIEYIEDPCPYNYEIWKELFEIIPIAADFELVNILKSLPSLSISEISKLPFDVGVIKSGRVPLKLIDLIIQSGKFITVTHSLESLYGQKSSGLLYQILKSNYKEKVLIPGVDVQLSYKDCSILFNEDSKCTELISTLKQMKFY